MFHWEKHGIYASELIDWDKKRYLFFPSKVQKQITKRILQLFAANWPQFEMVYFFLCGNLLLCSIYLLVWPFSRMYPAVNYPESYVTPTASFAALSSLSSGASSSALSNIGSCQIIKALVLQRNGEGYRYRWSGIQIEEKKGREKKGKRKWSKWETEERKNRKEGWMLANSWMSLNERMVYMAFLKIGDTLMFTKSVHSPAISDTFFASYISFISFYWNFHILLLFSSVLFLNMGSCKWGKMGTLYICRITSEVNSGLYYSKVFFFFYLQVLWETTSTELWKHVWFKCQSLLFLKKIQLWILSTSGEILYLSFQTNAWIWKADVLYRWEVIWNRLCGHLSFYANPHTVKLELLLLYHLSISSSTHKQCQYGNIQVWH